MDSLARAQLFEQVAMLHREALLRTANRMSGNRHAAEDLVQETLLQAWKSFDQLREGSSCKSWLFTIMRHQWVRERDKHLREEGLEKVLDRPDQSELHRRIFVPQVSRYISTLPEQQLTVLTLFAIEGFSLPEIAALLRIPLGTAASRLGRARALLRKAFEFKNLDTKLRQ